jgi:hypothetical protein
MEKKNYVYENAVLSDRLWVPHNKFEQIILFLKSSVEKSWGWRLYGCSDFLIQYLQSFQNVRLQTFWGGLKLFTNQRETVTYYKLIYM